jgi:hypothetical protein
VFDQRLVRKINQGRCFALIGSGPSTEVGYPSWEKLSEDTFAKLKTSGKTFDDVSYRKFIANRQFAELFSQAERDLGSRAELVSLIKSLLVPKTRGPHTIYDILANWPFACYLTTNWDDEIDRSLRANRIFFRTIENTKADFAGIRADASRLIVKLHSDLDHPERAVITSADYAHLIGGEGQYFRNRLMAMFEMFDVLIVGHSLSDPDLRLVLQLAKETASPEHPVFMIAAGATKAEELELLERFNVVALSYENTDGRHTQLRRLLSVMDKFVIPRHKRIDLQSVVYSSEELEAAQAVALYRRLAAASENDVRPFEYLGPLIMQSLKDAPEAVGEPELIGRRPLSSATTTEAIRNLIPGTLAELVEAGLLETTNSGYRLTKVGAEQATDISRQKTIEEEDAYNQFRTELSGRHPGLSDEDQATSEGMLRDTLIKVFKQRGISIANAIFAGRSLDHDALSDVFHAVTSVASNIEDKGLALAFTEAAQVFLLEPNPPQKQYLASISQGYFLYHLFGLDPTCSTIRREVFDHTIWWCDSNVLLPSLAVGCVSYEYATDLFSRLQRLGAFTLTTGRLLREVVEHLGWVSRLMDKNPLDSPAVLAAALQKLSFKQNLFLDGYIRLAAEGGVSKFSEYLKMVVPYGPTEAGILKMLESKGIRVVNVHEIEGYQDSDTREIFELSYEVREMRTNTATLRSDLQIEAEAEILQLIRKLGNGAYKPPVKDMTFERSYFLSQSRILDRIPPAEPVSWTPEALYRYIAALPGQRADADSLQRCMLHEYFGAGIVLIDKPRYEKFFEPSINMARTTYRQERDKYIGACAQHGASELDAEFERIPDLEKPFFVQQMGWKMATQERVKAEVAVKEAERAAQKAEATSMELARVKRERDTNAERRRLAREKQLAAEARNLNDPQIRKKRDRQAKKRARKRKG